MKTSKVKTVHSAKPYTGANGTTIYHNLTMENGDEINIGKKKEVKEGFELTYEIVANEDDGQRFKKAKSVQPQQQSNGNSYAPNPAKDKSIIAQVALKCATNVMQQSQAGHDSKLVLKMAEEFNTWLLQKSNIQ